MSYDTWKLASPWDNEKPSDTIEVEITFLFLDRDGFELGESTYTKEMRRDDAEELDDLGALEICAVDIDKGWELENGEKVKVKDIKF